MAMRNYRAMNDEKLRRCFDELVAEDGDAYDRVIAKGEDPEAHLNAARSACQAAGIDIGAAYAPPAPAAARTRAQEPARYIPPQLAFDGRKLLTDFAGPLDFLAPAIRDQWVMEPKFDGWRWQAHVLPIPARPVAEGQVSAETRQVRSIGGRNGKDHSGEVPEIDRELMELAAPGTILDGELMWENSLVGTRRLKKVQFIVFDVLRWEGIDVMARSWEHRREIIENAIPRSGLATDSPVVLNPVADVSEDTFDAWLRLGLEGAVFKRRAAPYVPGSRRRDGFVKMKPDSTTEATVIGWKYGEGASNRHMCGALEVVLHETEARTTVGYGCHVDEAEAMVGRIIEVQHYGFQPSGKVRHPGFRRLRPDLEPAS